MTDGQRDVALFEHLVGVDVENFAAVLSGAEIGVWEYDFDDDRVRYNAQLGSMLGLPSGGELSAEQAMAVNVPGEAVGRASRQLIAQAAEGRTFEVEHRMRGADGRWIRCVSTISPVVADDGTPKRLVGIIRNQEELARYRHRMHEAELMAQLGHWSVDMTADTVYWSDGVYAIYGFAPGEIRPTIEWVRSRYVERDVERLDRIVMEAFEGSGRFEFRSVIRRADDTERHVKVIGEIERDAAGEPVSFGGIIQDVTDEQEREAQVRQAQKMDAIGNLTGGAAHDFNNTLAVILGNLEVVRAELDRDDLRQHCDAAIAAAMSGAEVTRAMLSFARQAPLNPTAVDLNHVVRTVATWSARTLPATIETKMALAESLWSIDVDAALMESSILNLVLNARDAMPDGGQLTVETANVELGEHDLAGRNDGIEPGRYVMLSVGDTGHGLTEEVAERMFDPFFTTREEGAGTGLGLSMVQGFVRQSSGTIHLDTRPGVGTTLRLYFPAQGGTASDAALESTVDADPSEQTDACLLVVEDDDDVRAVLVELLTICGYEVHSAGSGDEALDLFDNGPWFDLLLTDVVMKGGLSGIELVERLRVHCPDLAVIYLSGYADWTVGEGNAVRPGDLRLTKPVRMADLVNSIELSLSDRNT